VRDLNTSGAGERSKMSNFIVKQEGPSPRVAEKVWEVRLGTGSLLLGALAGMLAGLYLGRRGGQSDLALKAKDWPVNIAHRGGAEIGPENTLEGFREGLRVGAGVLELDVHTTADGYVVVIHDAAVDRTTESTGAVREKTLAELKRLDAGYHFTRDEEGTFPYRGKGVRIPALEDVYAEFTEVPINVEIKGERPGIEKAVWRIVEEAGAEDRTLVVSESTPTIRRFREVSDGRVATASSSAELISFYLLSRLGLSRSVRPRYQALQGPETYHGLRIVTPGFIRAAHGQGLRVDVWTIDTEADMRRLLGYGVDGIMTDRPDVLAKLLKGGQ
jgi:glycerophosphoryl diester phosphodiesterase